MVVWKREGGIFSRVKERGRTGGRSRTEIETEVEKSLGFA